MVLCPVCGNKRCPRASNHIYACTGGNEVGQLGSAYIEQPKPQRVINGAIMTNEEIESIAQRRTYCKTDGEAVTLSRAERDALVAMARDGLRWCFVRDHADITLDEPVWFTTDSGQRINVSAFGRHESERAVDAALAQEK
jgi:hypothetical protein